jgi:hypothetical protein
MVNGLVPPYLSAIVPCNFENIHDYKYPGVIFPSTISLYQSKPEFSVSSGSTRNLNLNLISMKKRSTFIKKKYFKIFLAYLKKKKKLRK